MRQYLSNSSKGKLNSKERFLFLDYLQNSLLNGFSLGTSLELMPIVWSKQKKILGQLNKHLQAGAKLSKEMERLGFSKTVVIQIDLAMNQGNLVECLGQLASLSRLKNEQIKKLKAEMSYPFVLAVMMVLLLAFMQTFVSSQFANTGEHTGDIVLFVLLVMGLLFIYFLVKVTTLLKKQDYRSLVKLEHYPIIGSTIKLYVNYLLVYDAGLLLASGFSLQKMCEYAAKQETGSLQQVIGAKVGNQLRDGKSLEEIIKKEPFLPNELLLLVQTGAKKSDLSKRSLLLGKTLFTNWSNKIEKLIVNVQPFCFILIGLCIIGMYLKLFLPMYAMMQSI